MQQDYLLRMIQQLSLFMSGILHKRSVGDYNGAMVDLQDGYGRFVGLSPSLVHAISDDDLVNLLTARGGIDVERGLALAEILQEEAEIHDELGNESEAWPRFVKSLRLYLEVLEIDDATVRRELPGMMRVIERVKGFPLPINVEMKLAAFFEQIGAYDQSENLLVDLLERDAVSVESVVAYYDRLLVRDDAALIVGGLTHDEVAIARRSLMAH